MPIFFMYTPSSQLVLRLKTKSSEDYFLEACSREQRDDWANCISDAVEKLRVGDGSSEVPAKQRKVSSSLKLNNVNLR